jgi:hypothetical protein
MKDKKLAQEILTRVEREQKVRKAAIGGKAKRADYKKLDHQNTAWLKKVFAENGWPKFSLVGRKAADGVWLMVQHADQDLAFQKYALKQMKKVLDTKPDEASKMRFAYLTDRILSNQKKPLEFGTMYNTKGLVVTPMPTRDPKNVDQRRKAYGIKTTVEGRRRALIRELRALGAK